MRITDKQLAKCRASETTEQRIIHLLGYFGHYIYVLRGGLGGKQHVLKTLLLQGEMTQRELLELLHTSSASLSEVLQKDSSYAANPSPTDASWRSASPTTAD